MLRPLYSCVLSLHPRGFRRRFADEMLSIFDAVAGRRNRVSLLFDGLFSLVRQWTLRPEFWQGVPIEPVPAVPEGVPSFASLEPFRPRTGAMIDGLLLSVAMFCLTCFAIKYSWIHVLHVHIPEVQFERSQWLPSISAANTSAGKPSASTAGKAKESQAIPSAFNPLLEKLAAAPAAIDGKYAVAQSSQEGRSDSKHASALASAAQLVVSPNAPAITANAALGAAERQAVIREAIRHLRQYYVYPAVARKIAAELRRHDSNGDDDDVTDGVDFAGRLTTQMQQVSHDRHLAMTYSQAAIHETTAGPTLEAIARYRKEMERTNCTFEKAAMLPHNLAYVKFNSFPDLSICQHAAAAAMASLNQADAIIFDLRDNRGGAPGMVAFMASYLFQHPTHLDDLYNRREHSTLQSWTLSPIDGNKLADKPAYVLISAETFSAAEEFSYDLKVMKRATLVGETTAGGAYMARGHRVDDHFSIRVPDTRPINSISKSNWERSGVTPDVKVKAADALKTAQQLYEKSLLRP